MNVYQDAYIKKTEEQIEMSNSLAWLQGQYNMMSIGAAMNKKCKYPQKPLNLKNTENDISGEEKFLLWIDEFNRRFEVSVHSPHAEGDSSNT